MQPYPAHNGFPNKPRESYRSNGPFFTNKWVALDPALSRTLGPAAEQIEFIELLQEIHSKAFQYKKGYTG